MSKEAVSTPKKSTQALQKERDETIIKVLFHNHESPGSPMLGFGKLHKGAKVKKYKFEDGKIYDVDKGYIKYVNKTCRVPVWEHRDDEYGRPTMTMTRFQQRYSFENLAFMDDEDLRDMTTSAHVGISIPN